MLAGASQPGECVDEIFSRGEAFEVERHHSGRPVGDQVTEQFAGADIGLIAYGHESGNAQPGACGQVRDLGAELPALGDHRDRTRGEVAPRQPQFGGAVIDAQAVHPDRPEPPRR